MLGCVTLIALQLHCQIDQFMCFPVRIVRRGKFGRCLQRFRQCHFRLVRNIACQFCAITHRLSQYAPNIFNSLLCRKCAKCDDPGAVLLTIFVSEILNNLRPPRKFDVCINIWIRNPFRIQESLKKQLVLDRVNIGDPKAISRQTSRCASATRANIDTALATVVDKVPDHDKIFLKLHLPDHVDFIFKPIHVYRVFLLFRPTEPLRISISDEMFKVIKRRFETCWNLILRKVYILQFDIHIAALRDFQCVIHRFRMIGE